MQITVNIPDETAERMLGDAKDAARILLELAGYTAYENGRISEYEYMKLLGLDSRFELHAVMKRIRRESEALQTEFLRQDMSAIVPPAHAQKVSKSG